MQDLSDHYSDRGATMDELPGQAPVSVPLTPADTARTRARTVSRPGVARVDGGDLQASGARVERTLTVTESELDALIQRRVSLQLSQAGIATPMTAEDERSIRHVRTQADYSAAIQEGRKAVPILTMAEAKAIAAANAERGLPVEALFTASGWYIHERAGFVAPPAERV